MELTKEELQIVGTIFSTTDTLVEMLELDEPEMADDLEEAMEADEAVKVAKQISKAYLTKIWETETTLLEIQGLSHISREDIFEVL